MGRLLLLLPLFFLASELVAQEVLTPLASNPYVQEKGKKARNKSQHDSASIFIYPLDTLSLPLKDDFSTDRFKPYATDTSASGVKDSIFYRLFNGNDQILRDTIGTWAMDTVGWRTDTSFIFHYDTVGGDTVRIGKTPFPARDILVNDLWTPEHDTVRFTAWPALKVRDSTWIPKQDTMRTNSRDYIQDSLPAFYFPSDSTRLWTDQRVFRNFTLSKDPPTIGMASFDGLDAEGLPYDFSNPYTYGEADHLTSKPIDMALTPLDSVFISFFYQRKGLGNEPEQEDSLVLEFYEPTNDQWTQVWSKEGGGSGSPKQVLVPIQDPDFLHKGFRFRFKNFATLSGGFDHWHLDYVRIQKNRNPNDTVISDIAYTRLPDSFLKTYTSVPWKHYQADSGHVIGQYTSHHRNLDNAGRFVDFDTRAYFEGNQFWFHDQGVNANVQPDQPFTHNNIVGQSPADLEFSPSFTDTSAVFRVSMIQRTNPDTNASNDSVTFEQRFLNYYAYDDGTAEVAYGISPSGANTPKIAQRFNPYIADTVVGAYIMFAPAFEDMSKESFFLTLWDNEGGVPGDVIFQNITFSKPDYGKERGHFRYYPFDDPVVLNDDGRYFVGVDQTTQERINIGMDRNNDNGGQIYFNADGTWQNSSFEGSLMIRPVYASDIQVQDLPRPRKEAPELSVKVYPNPSDGKFRIRSEGRGQELTLSVHDLSGRKLIDRRPVAGTLDLSDRAEGIYLLRIRDERSGRSTVKKLMIQR
jgi:hypothetical protein